MPKTQRASIIKHLILWIYDKIIYKPFIRKPKIKNTEETLLYILSKKCSVSRYGDGELNQCWKVSHIGFQSYNQALTTRLKEILFKSKRNDNNHIVCIPYSYINTNYMTDEAAFFWNNLTLKHKLAIIPKLPARQFYDTQCTRLYIDYKEKSKTAYYYDLWKKIWNKQDVIIIEGSASKLGVGNDLFSNTNSLKRILVPEKNAFDVYESILSTAKKHCSKSNLILLAIGPTATVLAYDLAALGYWAIDVGHIDIEYMWFKMNATKKVPIEGKSVNEVLANGTKGGDDEYMNSIIDNIIS